MPNVSASNLFRGDCTTQNEGIVEQKDGEIKTEHYSNVQTEMNSDHSDTEMKSEIVKNDTVNWGNLGNRGNLSKKGMPSLTTLVSHTKYF